MALRDLQTYRELHDRPIIGGAADDKRNTPSAPMEFAATRGRSALRTSSGLPTENSLRTLTAPSDCEPGSADLSGHAESQPNSRKVIQSPAIRGGKPTPAMGCGGAPKKRAP